jgi:hypothetical protein
MWTDNGRQATDANWWQKLTLTIIRMLVEVLSIICNTIFLQFSLCRVWVCFYWFHHVFLILSVIL